MSEEREDNDQANGLGGRFDGLDLRFKKGGGPRQWLWATPTLQSAYDRLCTFGNYEDVPEPYQEPLIKDMMTMDVVREMHAVKEAKEAADLLAKALGAQFDYLRLQLVPERFEAEGIKLLKVDGVGRVGLRGELYASIMPGKKDAAFEWLSDNGRGDLVQQQVNAGSLKASLKKMMEKGEEIPEGLFKVTPYTMATITRS